MGKMLDTEWAYMRFYIVTDFGFKSMMKVKAYEKAG